MCNIGKGRDLNLFIYVMFLELPVKVLPAHSKLICRFGLIPAKFFQGINYLAFLDFLPAVLKKIGNTRRQVLRVNDTPRTENYGMLHYVLQFSDITGPVMSEKYIFDRLGNIEDIFIHFFVKVVKKMLHQKRDILFMFP